MFNSLAKWFRTRFKIVVNSIAFIPALIAIGFLFLSWGMLELDFSTTGRHIKSSFSWLSLKDANTARSIISTITAGIISLTVFSFSLVMIVLTQAASQMSNRILSSMIENRFQQLILGFYIGSIVYALFLLSTIRDINSGVYVPALSIYLLILLTIIDIFLFIYFLDYVTQTVKYETVIHRVEKQTLKSMKNNCFPEADSYDDTCNWNFVNIVVRETGYFQGFESSSILKLLKAENLKMIFVQAEGNFLLKGCVLAKLYYVGKISEDIQDKLWAAIDFYRGQPIDRNPEYGFQQLAEVAIKALSPGINDPATAVISLHALYNLFLVRLSNVKKCVFMDEQNEWRIQVKVRSFDELFRHCIYPIWNYGKKDQYVRQTLLSLSDKLYELDLSQVSHHSLEWLKKRDNRSKMIPKAPGQLAFQSVQSSTVAP